MRNRRAFTLIELTIVIAIISIVTVPFLLMADRIYASYHRTIRLAELNSETDRVGFRIQALWRESAQNSQITGNRILENNRGLQLADGRRLTWKNRELTLEQLGKSLTLSKKVTHFSAHQRDGLTRLTIVLEDPLTGSHCRRVYIAEKARHAARI